MTEQAEKQNSTSLPAGYKQTEVGVIPEDWHIEQLVNLISDNPKYGIGASACDFDYNLPTYLRITDINEKGKIIETGLKSVNHAEAEKYYLEEGDLVFARTGASVGKSYLYDKRDGLLVYAGFLIKVKPNKRLLNPNFLKAVVSTDYYWNWVQINSMRSGQPGINSFEFGQLLIALPPTLEEQQAIATALSEVDELIQSLERLIAKKQAIKQGAMQELLTGKTRLKGFEGSGRYQQTEVGLIPEEWKLKNIESLVVKNGLIRGPFGGALKKESFVRNGYKVYEQKNAIYQSVELGEYYIDESKFKELKRFEIQKDDFILSCSGTIGRLFQIPKDFKKGVINQALLIIRLDPEITDFKYFMHQFTSEPIQNKVIDDTQGGAMKNLIGMSDFKKAKLPYPPTIEEQKAIAQILFDMDKEIEALEQKKAKYQQIKQGMMQELLTGKTRLI